jgi:hypothetical protein
MGKQVNDNSRRVDKAMIGVHRTISGVWLELLFKTIDVGERSVNRLRPIGRSKRRTPIEGEGLSTND